MVAMKAQAAGLLNRSAQIRFATPRLLNQDYKKASAFLGLIGLGLSGCGGGGGSRSGSPSDIRRSVVFESNRDGDFEILRMQSDGSGVTRVTNNTTNDIEPSFSPDGSRIVFVSNRGGNNQLYLVSSQGTQQLTRNSFNDNQPDFSPDGTKIVFSSNRNGLTDLYLLDIASGQETQLTSSIAAEQDPTFTSEGTIIYSSLTRGQSQIFEIGTNGGAPTLIPTNLQSNQFRPAISPDGKLLAYVSDQAGNLDIFVMDRATKVSRVLVNSPQSDTAPAFSRDGRSLFFSSSRTGNEDIFSIDLNGNNVRNLTRNPASDRIPSAG